MSDGPRDAARWRGGRRLWEAGAVIGRDSPDMVPRPPGSPHAAFRRKLYEVLDVSNEISERSIRLAADNDDLYRMLDRLVTAIDEGIYERELEDAKRLLDRLERER